MINVVQHCTANRLICKTKTRLSTNQYSLVSILVESTDTDESGGQMLGCRSYLGSWLIERRIAEVEVLQLALLYTKTATIDGIQRIMTDWKWGNLIYIYISE